MCPGAQSEGSPKPQRCWVARISSSSASFCRPSCGKGERGQGRAAPTAREMKGLFGGSAATPAGRGSSRDTAAQPAWKGAGRGVRAACSPARPAGHGHEP